MIENLRHLLSDESEAEIESALERNVVELYSLGKVHFRFARRLSDGSWRHAVSRLYFAGYNMTRSVRLCVDGHYSTEVKEHQRFERLPDDFGNRDRYANDLPLLRADRNLCDYDHTAGVDELVRTPLEWAAFVADFMKESRVFLRSRGVGL